MTEDKDHSIAEQQLAEYAQTIVGQIIGGLYLELKERFPDLSIHLGGVQEEPAIRISSFWIVVHHDMFKVIVPQQTNQHMLVNGTMRRVLFECSMSQPNDDFQPLYDWLNQMIIDWDET